MIKKIKKPVLVKVGKHFINVNDVAQISQVKNKLWIIKLFSNPNPEFPIWITTESEISFLMSHFEIQTADDNNEEDND